MKSFMKRMLGIVVAFAVLAGEMLVPSEVQAAKKPTIMVLNTKVVLVKLKGKQSLIVEAVAPKGASKAVKYEVANRRIAGITSKGTVKGKRIGITTIRVTSRKNKKLRKLVKVIVAKNVPKKVKMSAASIKMKKGQKKTLKATVTPAKVLKVHKKGHWYSSDPETASVTAKGVVSAKAAGEAVITFETMNGIKATCKVQVEEKSAVAASSAPDVHQAPQPTFPVSGGAVSETATQPAVTTPATDSAVTEKPAVTETAVPATEQPAATTQVPETVSASPEVTVPATGTVVTATPTGPEATQPTSGSGVSKPSTTPAVTRPATGAGVTTEPVSGGAVEVYGIRKEDSRYASGVRRLFRWMNDMHFMW